MTQMTVIGFFPGVGLCFIQQRVGRCMGNVNVTQSDVNSFMQLKMLQVT